MASAAITARFALRLPRHRHAEGGHDRIAHELVDGAAVPDDDLYH
jgi:hypothetical protein